MNCLVTHNSLLYPPSLVLKQKSGSDSDSDGDEDPISRGSLNKGISTIVRKSRSIKTLLINVKKKIMFFVNVMVEMIIQDTSGVKRRSSADSNTVISNKPLIDEDETLKKLNTHLHIVCDLCLQLKTKYPYWTTPPLSMTFFSRVIESRQTHSDTENNHSVIGKITYQIMLNIFDALLGPSTDNKYTKMKPIEITPQTIIKNNERDALRTTLLNEHIDEMDEEDNEVNSSIGDKDNNEEGNVMETEDNIENYKGNDNNDEDNTYIYTYPLAVSFIGGPFGFNRPFTVTVNDRFESTSDDEIMIEEEQQQK
jgi:hypothetical protein